MTPPYIANVSVCPKLVWMNNSRIRLKFEGSCLKQEEKAPLTPDNVVNLFTAYNLYTSLGDFNNDFTLRDCLFESVKLTKNQDKCKYCGYRI